MAFDLQGARDAGFSDDEIADYLGKKAGFDTQAARRAGYETRDILAELSSAWAKQELPEGVKPSDAGGGRGRVAPTDEAIPKPTTPKGPTAADLKQGPGAVLENVRQAARPADRIGKGGRPEQAPAFTADPLSKPNPDFTPGPADLQAGQISDERALREAKQRAYVNKVGAPNAQAPSADMLLGESVAGVSDNPLYRGVAGGVSNLAQTGIGAVRAGADVLGLDGVAEFAKGASKKAGAVEQAATADLKGNDKLAADIFASITASAPSMAVGMIGGPGLKTLFAQSALAEYNTGRNAGFSEAESATRAGIFGMAEALGERFGFPQQIQLLKSIGKHVPTSELGKVAAEMLAKEIPGEQLTTAMQFMADKFGPAAQNPNATLSDYLDQAGQTLKVTIGQSALMGGGPVAISKAKDAYRAADKAIGGDTSTPMGAEALAKSKGFLADQRPVDIRTEAFKRLDDVGAKHGIPSNVLGLIKKAADGKPVEDLTGWIRRALTKLSQTGDIAPVDDATLSLLDQPTKTDTPPSGPAPRGAEDGNAEKPGPGQTEAAPMDFSGLADSSTPVDQAAHAAATSPRNDLPEPTEAQKSAGNYAKGHVRIAGIDFAIENPAGSVRRGTAPDGRQWETPMVAHYGYAKGTRAGDGDHSDVFIKPGTDETWTGTAFVIDQIDPKTGKFDEHKTVLGADSEEEAKALYLANYEKGWGGLGAITALPIDAYKSWVKDGVKSKPLGTLPQGPGTAAPVQPAATSTGANDGQGQEGRGQTLLTPEPAVGVTYKAPDGRTLRIYVSTPNRVGVADEKGNKSSIARGSPGWAKMEQAIAASQPKTETALQPAPAVAPVSQPNPAEAIPAADLVDAAKPVEAPAPAPKPTKRPKVRNHPDTVRGSNALAEVSRTLGGISPDIIADLSQKTTRTRTSSKTGKKTIFTTWDNPAIPGVGPLFRRGGTSDLTEIARVLEDAGYIEAGLLERDYLEARSKAQDIIKAELSQGGSTLRIGDPEAVAAEAKRREEAAAEDWAASDFWSPDDLDATGYTDLGEDERIAADAILADVDALGLDRESIIERAAMEAGDLTTKEYHDVLKRIADEAVQEHRRQAVEADTRSTGQGDQGGGSDAQAPGRPGGDRADGPDQAVQSDGEAEGLTLTSETEAEAQAKADRETKALADERAKKDADRRRAEADAMRDEFTLVGSQRPADVAMAAGQDDLFGARAEDVGSAKQDLEAKRKALIDIENRMVGMAGLAPGFVEEAMRSRKVPRALKDERDQLRDDIRGLREQVAKMEVPVRDMEQYIKVAADSIADLRKTDVYRVLVESNRAEFRQDIATYIKANRPDLAREVDDVLAEQEDGQFPPAVTIPAEPSQQADPQAKTADAPRLTDAGEELIRNRRGKLKGLSWSDVSDLNDTLKVAQVVKSNVWPRPDYAKMVEDGAPAWKAAALKAVYDKLAAAPSTRTTPTDADLRAYIETMHSVRDAILTELDRVAGLPDGGELWKSLKAENVFGRVFPLPADARALYGRPSPFDRMSEQGKENNRRAMLIGGNNAVQALQFNSKMLAKVKDLLADGFPAKQEAWQKSYEVRPLMTRDSDVPEAERTGEPQERFYVYEKGSLWRLASGVQDGGFATREQAEAFARSPTVKKKDVLPPSRGLDLADASRTGPDWRGGRNVTAQDIMDRFGFRGVNLGEYVKAKQSLAQAHMNHVYDAFSDLADLLGVPPKAMSLNGTLGVAVGAQGSGKALAHFVPGVNEINITRDSGAGALAHEFGHALDHYFAAQHGKAVSMAKRPYLSAAIDGMRDPGGVRPEVIEAMRFVMKTMNTRPMTEAEAKQFIADQRDLNRRRLDRWIQEFKGNKGSDAKALDAVAEKLKRGDLGEATADGELEPNVAELVRASGLKPGNSIAAHAITVAYRLRDLADESRFMARHLPQKPTDYAKASDAMDAKKREGDGYWSTPWEKFARAFETFVMDALKDRQRESLYLSGLVDSQGWKNWAEETGKSIPYPAGDERLAIQQAFQSLVDTIETREDDAGNVAMLSRPDLKRDQAANDAGLSASDLQPVVNALTSNGVKATVLPSRDQLPPAALAEVKTVDPTGIARGALTSDGQIWLFANRLGSHAEAFEVALHEGFHRGLRLLGDKGSKVLAQIYATNAKVRKLADAYQKDYPDLDREDATNEALADLAGRGEVEKLNYWAALKRLVRDFLRRVADAAGIAMEWTDADVTRLVASMSRKGLTNGAHADGGAQLQRVWHGTPHRGIEKFSTDKIGTGEGAQAYGWGLYFASKKEIAEWYRNSLTAPKINGVKMNGRRVDAGTPVYHAVLKVVEAGGQGTREEVVAHLRDRAQAYRSLPDHFQRQAANILGLREVEGALKKVEAAKSFAVDMPERNPGQLYEVEIPDDEHMLLWDKPLSEQPAAVRAQAARVFKKYVEPTVEVYWTLDGQRLDTNSPDFSLVQKIASQGYDAVLTDAKARVESRASRPAGDPLRKAADAVLARVEALAGREVEQITRNLEVVESDVTGKALYSGMERSLGSDKAASEALAALGIKGIKYLDGTSRADGEGSFNYVVFSGDDTKVERALLSRPPRHTPEEQAALAKAGITPGRTLRQSVVQAWNKATMLLRNRDYLKLAAQQATLDQFAGIKDVVQRELGGLPVDQDPYITARLANGGSASVMHALLLHGQAKWAPNKQHLVKIDGTRGLLDILAPLGDDLNDWFGWMVGNRAERLKREGRENNLTDADIKALQGLASTPEKLAKFRAAAVEYAAFKRSVLDIAEGAGLIDPAGRKVWDHADYIPFYRQIDERSTFTATGKKGLAGQSSGIRVLKGGESALNDPMENLLMNFSRLIDASLKNNALRKTIDAVDGTWLVSKVGYEMTGQLMPKSQVKKILEDAGTPPDIIDVLPDEAFDGMAKIWAIQAPTDPNVVRVMVGGKPQFYRVDEPVLLRSLTSFVPFDMPGLAAARMFKRLLTSAVTSTPDFLARNFIRDSLATKMIARDPVTVGAAIRGLGRSFAEKGAGEAMLFAGASFQGGQVSAGNIEGSARTVRRALRRKGIHAGMAGAAAVVIDSPARLWDFWTQARDATENANREAVYEAALKAGRGGTMAAFEAKDLMDFSLRGGHPLYQVSADVLPFFNARVQGLYRLARVGGPGAVGKAALRRFATYAVMMSILSAALAAINAGRDDYNRLPDWEKDTYWHLFVGGQHFKIPKPFELGAMFGTLPERITRYLMGVDTGSKLGHRIGAILHDQLAVDLVPQMFRPALDVYANWDAFRDRPIETTGDEGKIPSQRFDARTSPTATAAVQAVAPLADRVGLSPKRLEYLIGGYLGTVGTYALGGVDIMVRGITDGAPTPSWRADDIPVVKSFYAVDPARATVYESDLYAMREEIEKVYKSIQASLKQEDEAAAEYLRQRFSKELAAREAIKDGADDLATIRKEVNAIYADKTMTPQRKRELIDQLQVERNKIAEQTMKVPEVQALR